MIKDLVQSGRSIADRLMLLDALNSHYELLFASDGSDVTEDPSTPPSAMLWIHDRDRAAVVVAVQRVDTDADYVADVLIRPYTRDAVGRHILCESLPEDHPRCRLAAKEAAMALAVHTIQRRLNVATDVPLMTRAVDGSEAIPPRGDLSLLRKVCEYCSGTCSWVDTQRQCSEFGLSAGDRNVWSDVTSVGADPEDDVD